MKIENLVEKDTVLDDDYLIVNGTDGTKKAKKSNFLSELNSRTPEGSKGVFEITGTFTTDSYGKKDLWSISQNLTVTKFIGFIVWSTTEYTENICYEIYSYRGNLYVAVENDQGERLSNKTFSYRAIYS